MIQWLDALVQAEADFSLFRRAAMRDFRRLTLFLCKMPFCTARSMVLNANRTAVSASATLPASTECNALAIADLVSVRSPLVRMALFTCLRPAFFAGNLLLL